MLNVNKVGDVKDNDKSIKKFEKLLKTRKLSKGLKLSKLKKLSKSEIYLNLLLWKLA